MATRFLVDGPDDAPVTLALAPGAGGAMDAPWMTTIARVIAPGGSVRVVRFEFAYMAAGRAAGKRRPPSATKVLEAEWRAVVEALSGRPLFIGGKSMGGRIASHVAGECGAAGLVCLGYPFHPPGRPEQLRTAHLETLRMPALIVQGERDPFGKPAEVAGYALSPSIRVHWIADGDHSLKPRKQSGRTEAGNLAEAAAAVRGFIADVMKEAHP